MKRTLVIIALGLGLIGLNSCKKKEQKVENEKVSCEGVSWGYEGKYAPKTWASLCTDFSDCAGEEQSPIDIQVDSVKAGRNLPTLDFAYDKTAVNIANNGHALIFNVSGENTLTIGEDKYNLLQFHYHTASEHTVNGHHYPMEVHFVHKGAKGLAVVGMFFEVGESNALLENYLQFFPAKKGENNADKTIPLTALLPTNLKYYHYDGSLTTPPCSEIVDWYVLQQPITATAEQIEAMAKIMHNNFRPVQALNGREVVKN